MNIERYKKMFDKYIYNMFTFYNDMGWHINAWAWRNINSIEEKVMARKKDRQWLQGL